jgi:hypothetical protein
MDLISNSHPSLTGTFGRGVLNIGLFPLGCPFSMELHLDGTYGTLKDGIWSIALATPAPAVLRPELKAGPHAC